MFVFIKVGMTEIVADVNEIPMLVFSYLAYQCHVYMSKDIYVLR